ncbi:HpcH/HpaI aldolase/citrate lyase family protein [Microvirga pudoricolor]|uniref:HpcH/HpaI aldolase/citrate lyase family protein n=1 Tax=Microvirga pudoricolor TaxID=2778729 RepID=UPI00194EABA2|nr:CoA ester lyase [Microvirga pudoricolor]MBM6593817.1 CoA ester lyase [Microvirga pudoricolor]
MIAIRPRRSVLYMPGSNARALEKARTLPADALIFDLEDAVAPDAKESAREAVRAAVAGGGYGPRELVVRINPLESPWGEADLAAVAGAGPDAVLVPKVHSPEDLVAVGLRLRRHGAPDKTRVWAMIETPLAVLDARALASTAGDVDTRLSGFVMGTNDLAKDTRTRLVPGRVPMLPWLMGTLTAARAYGLDILDGVYNDLSDAGGFRAECEQGRDLGFDGKTLVHPGQIASANAVFAPSAEEVALARAVVDAFARPENAGRAVIGLEGRMVERLHADMAERTLALATAIRERD